MHKLISISVVIPLFNRQGLILETLKSVENQHLLPCEVIIVDDQSTDCSVNIITEYAKRSNLEIKIIRNNSLKGVSAATNIGIKNAKGNFIALLDSDDLWTPNHLKQLHSSLIKYPEANIAFSGIETFGDAADIQEITIAFMKSVSKCLDIAFEKKEPTLWLSNSKLLYSLLAFGFPFRCPASLIKKDFIFKYNLFFNEKLQYTQDAQLMIMAAYYTPFVYVEKIGLQIRRHSENYRYKQYQEIIPSNYEIRSIDLKRFFYNKKLNIYEKRALHKCLWELQSYTMFARSSHKYLFFKIKEAGRLILRAPSLISVKSIMKLFFKKI